MSNSTLAAKTKQRFPSEWFGKPIRRYSRDGKIYGPALSGFFDLLEWRWCFQYLFDVDEDEYTQGVALSLVGKVNELDRDDNAVAYDNAMHGDAVTPLSDSGLWRDRWVSFDETHFSDFVVYHRGRDHLSRGLDPEGVCAWFEEFSPPLSANKRFQYDPSCRLWVMQNR